MARGGESGQVQEIEALRAEVGRMEEIMKGGRGEVRGVQGWKKMDLRLGYTDR